VGSAPAVRSAAAIPVGGAPIPARDFLGELERSRTEAAHADTFVRDEDVPVVRPERSVGQAPAPRASSYEQDLEIPAFLRRGNK
jgi:hypothetical protein